jgi:hypothetical protein
MIIEAVEHRAGGRGTVSMWAAVLGAPVLWAVHLSGRIWMMHATSLAFLVLTSAGGALAWRDWRRVGEGSPKSAEGGELGRARFLAVLGMLTSGLFFLIILATSLAAFFVDPCAV